MGNSLLTLPGGDYVAPSHGQELTSYLTFSSASAKLNCFHQKQMCAVEERIQLKTVLTEFPISSGLTFVATCALEE